MTKVFNNKIFYNKDRNIDVIAIITITITIRINPRMHICQDLRGAHPPPSMKNISHQDPIHMQSFPHFLISISISFLSLLLTNYQKGGGLKQQKCILSPFLYPELKNQCFSWSFCSLFLLLEAVCLLWPPRLAVTLLHSLSLSLTCVLCVFSPFLSCVRTLVIAM